MTSLKLWCFYRNLFSQEDRQGRAQGYERQAREVGWRGHDFYVMKPGSLSQGIPVSSLVQSRDAATTWCKRHALNNTRFGKSATTYPLLGGDTDWHVKDDGAQTLRP